MRALVTGVTGKVGHATARALLEAGYDVRGLVRDPSRAAGVVPSAVDLVRGDVTRPATLKAAATGCELVFSAHGLPEQWLTDPGEFDRVNVDGAVEVVRAAISAGARRVVHTSTIDVFAKDADGVLREVGLDRQPKRTAYERSKQRAEEAVLAAADGAVEIVMVNPAAVYGPGPRGSASLELTLFAPVARAERTKLPLLPPGGAGVVFADGVGRGQLLAAERGTRGERYILCDAYLTMRELAETVRRVAGQGRVPPAMPVALARAMAVGGEALARVIRRRPLLPMGQLTFLLWQARPDASRAERELGWRPTPVEDGVRETLRDLGLLRAP